MQVVLNILYVSLWIGLSGAVIIYNKWILAVFGFPYPITLTMWHMGFSSVLAFVLVRDSHDIIQYNFRKQCCRHAFGLLTMKVLGQGRVY